MDKGPWVIHKSATGIWHVCSDDSTHDVTLDIMGDFGKGEAKQYIKWLANELNDCAALRAENERLWGVVVTAIRVAGVAGALERISISMDKALDELETALKKAGERYHLVFGA